MQKALAQELTTRVHSQAACHQAAQAAELLFGQATQQDLQGLSEADLLALLANVPKITLSQEQLAAVADVVTLVSSATRGCIFPSKGAARRMIQGGGLSINKTKIHTPQQQPAFALLHGKYLLVQQGKKHHHLVVVE